MPQSPPPPNDTAATSIGGATKSIGVEIVTLAKRNGPLTKRIALDANGKLVSDGSACVMGSGRAWRTDVPSMAALAGHIAGTKHEGAGGAFYVVQRGGDWFKSVLPVRVLS